MLRAQRQQQQHQAANAVTGCDSWPCCLPGQPLERRTLALCAWLYRDAQLMPLHYASATAGRCCARLAANATHASPPDICKHAP